MKLYKFVLAFITIFLCILLLSWVTKAADVEFSWLPNTEEQLKGYSIHYGELSRQYTKTIDVGKPETVSGRVSAVITNVPETTDIYFAATAEDTGGLHSDFSNEVMVPASEEVLPIAPQSFVVDPATVTFSWVPSTDIDLDAYSIYCSVNQGTTSNHELWKNVPKDSIVDNRVSYTWEQFPSGPHYCVAVTLIMRENVIVSSDFSTEIMFIAPMQALPIPQNFEFVRIL